MGKATQRRIDIVLKRKRDEVDEDPPTPASDGLPLLLLELEEQQHNHAEEQSNEPVTFRGVEFLQRDPGLRPQIWQYRPEQRDTVRRAYLSLGPMQPHLQNYRLSGEQGHRRRFQYSWFGLFPSWLEYSEEIFEITEVLGQAVQKKSQDIVNAVRLVSSTKECLQQLRSDDGYQQFIDKVIEFCVNHSIDIPNFEDTYILRGGRARHQPDQLTKEHYFRVEIFLATLDTQLFELNRRFNEKVMDLLSTSATLIPRNKFKGFKATDICEMVKKYYPADFPQDVYTLQQQLNHFVVDASKDEELKSISTLIDLCRCFVETGRHTMYNLIERLLRLLITLPVSTASVERAFSSMKIIKTRLRNKMEDDYLANNLLVNIEGEILETYSYEDIIADFSGKKDRKADL